MGGPPAPAAGAKAPPPHPAVPPHAVPPHAVPVRTPETLLREGQAALARRDYTAAEADARAVLAGPKSPRQADAQFLLAQALSGKHAWQNAAIAYDDSFRRAPKGIHAQDSLLGLANSLTAIRQVRAACGALNQLSSDFPTPRADLRTPIANARKRAGCH